MSVNKDKADDAIDALTITGMPKGIARTLTFLSAEEDWSTSRDIERATSLRQPEVSIAVRKLEERGWVERDSLKRESKGRPINIYRMSVGMGNVYSTIEAGERDRIAGVEGNLAKIREMWSIK